MVMTVTRAPTGGGQAPRPRSFRLYATVMSEERTLFTTAEAAAMLGISPQAVRTAAWIGTLQVEKINPRLNMVTREAIEAYRRDYLGRVGRPSRKKAAATRKAAAPRDDRDQTAHDARDEGHTMTPRE